MAGQNPTIIATISAEDKTKAAIQTATAALRELNKAAKSTGKGAFDGLANEQRRLGEALNQTTHLMGNLKNQTVAARNEISLLGRSLEGLKQIGGMIIGGDIAHAGKKAVETAAHYEELKNKIFNVSGRNEKEVISAEKIAADASKAFPIVTRRQAMEDYIELRKLNANEDGSVNEAGIKHGVDIMAKTRAAAAATGIKIGEGEALALATAIEGSGRAGDPVAVNKMMDSYIRGKQVLGTALTADKIRDFVANAKSSNFALSDNEFYYSMMARLAQGNASRLGNEYAQTYSTLVGGKMTKQGAQWLVDTGQITQDQIVDGKGGKFYIRGDIKGKDVLSSDPTKWTQEVLLPGLEKKGVLADDKVDARVNALKASDPNADAHTLRERAYHGLIADDLMKAGFRATVADNLAHAIGNELLIKKDVAQMKRATGVEAADTINRNPVAAFQELTNAIETFGTVLANPIMSNVAKVLDAIAQGVSSLSTALEKFQKDHPVTGQVLAGAVPAGAVVGGGALAWGVLDGFLNGFGLKGSAVALDKSALALETAAGRLGVAGAAPGGGKPGVVATPGGGGGISGWFGLVPKLYGFVSGMADAEDLIRNWSKKSGTDKTWSGINLAADGALMSKNPVAMAFGAALKALSFVNENSKTYKWKTTEDEDRQAEIARQEKAFRESGFPMLRDKLPKIDTQAPAAPVKADVSGTVTGSVETVQHIEVNPSPLLTAIVDRAKSISVPVTGKLGTVMGGENGIRNRPAGIGDN